METSNTKAKKITARNHEDVKRTDSHNVDPRKINVIYADNPRHDYHVETGEFEELKASIAKEGVKTHLTVYIKQSDGLIYLSHGYTRMKAVQELLSDGVDISSVPVIFTENNRETHLYDHITLNRSNDLKDIEKAHTLIELFQLNGGKYDVIAERTGMPYQKVYNLIKYMRSASEVSKDMVLNEEIALSSAMEIAKQLEDVRDQNEVLKEAKENATAEGSKTIRPRHISSTAVKLPTKKDDSVKIFKGFTNYLTTVGQQQIEIAQLVSIVEKIEAGTTLDQIIEEFLANS